MKLKRKPRKSPRKAAPVKELPAFPNEFWETILRIRRDEPKRFNLFSPGIRRSTEIYEEQRDRALVQQRAA